MVISRRKTARRNSMVDSGRESELGFGEMANPACQSFVMVCSEPSGSATYPRMLLSLDKGSTSFKKPAVAYETVVSTDTLFLARSSWS